MNDEYVHVRVWDLSTRLFHWGMVVLVCALWWTGEEGMMVWHQISAYVLLILILFRLIWGVIGSDTAKFSRFVTHPKAVLDYVRQIFSKKDEVVLGHNPAGGYMVVILLSIISLQLFTGLFTTDDIYTEGPLLSYVSSDLSSWLTWLHKTNFNGILLLAAIHISAVVLYTIKGEKLIGAMLNGKKSVARAVINNQPQLNFKPKILAFSIWLMLTAVIFTTLIWPLLQQL